METKKIVEGPGIESARTLGEFAFDNSIKLSDLNISSRTCSYWRTQRLLPFVAENKMVKVNIIEASWLKVLDSLSNFGFPVAKMVKLTEDLFYTPFREKYADKLLSKSLDALAFDNRNAVKIAEMRNFLTDEIGMIEIRKDVNPFSTTIKEILCDRQKRYMVIDKEGNNEIILAHDDNASDLLEAITAHSKIVIPLHEFIKELIAVDIVQSTKTLRYLSPIENEIIEVLRTNNWTDLNISSKHQLYKIVLNKEKTVSALEFAKLIIDGKISEATHFEVTSRPNGQVGLLISKKYSIQKLPAQHRST
jgi:hypothetical protein